MTTDDADVEEGVSSILPIQAQFDVSASKDMIRMPAFSPRGTAQLFASVREAAAMHPTAIPSAAFPEGFRDRVPITKQAPSKQADLQVKAVDLNRENCSLADFESNSRFASPPLFENQDMQAERLLDSRLSRSVEAFIGEHSDDCLDLQFGTASRETSEGFLELLDSRVAELGQNLSGIFSDMLDSRIETRIATLETRFSAEMLESRVEARLAALESQVFSELETLDSRVETRFAALESQLFSETLDSRVEARLAALESHAAERQTSDSEVARLIDEEVRSLGKQMQTINNRIAKITSRSQVRTEHIVALEDRVVSLDRSLSELRCEYLEGSLRHHQMEELVIALHSSIRDLRVTQGNSKHGHSSDGGNSPRSPRRRHVATDLHAGVSGDATDADSIVRASRRERRQAKLEPISETVIDEPSSADSVPVEQGFVTQVNESGKAESAEESVPSAEETEPSLTEPEPESQAFSTPGGAPESYEVMKENDNDNVDNVKQASYESSTSKIRACSS